MQEMFTSTSLSTSNYDVLLMSWSELEVRSGVNFSGGDSTFCLGEMGRDKLINVHNWIISDNGKDCLNSITETNTTWFSWEGDTQEGVINFTITPNNNNDRFNKLLSVSNIQPDEGIEWSIIRQTGCTSEQQARKLFHGFEVLLEYPDDLNLTTIEIDTSIFKDFVVEKVLKRNEWQEMLIVSDMTGSMSPYISQLFLWLKLNALDDRIKQFVFFNDGDSSLDENKKIGKTGGLYQTKSKDYDEVVRIATQCIISGTGGDVPENDMEALMKGIKLCPDCMEYILIADNLSPVRDLKLLRKINRPIRVILCGVLDEINPEYLNLARSTGGSIHLIEEDLFNLMEINEGEIIEINEIEYIVEKNRFTKYTKI